MDMERCLGVAVLCLLGNLRGDYPKDTLWHSTHGQSLKSCLGGILNDGSGYMLLGHFE